MIMNIFPRLIWAFRHIFLASNWLQWYLMAPLQHSIHQSKTDRFHKYFLFATPLRFCYWIFMYIALMPLRFLNAIYFDMILFWSVAVRDGLADLFHPKLGRYRDLSGIKYAFYWIFLFPIRFVQFILKFYFVLLQGFLMTGFDIVWPTLTLFHGTTFERAATKIAQTGMWFVGGGNYAGTGIYFGMKKQVAEYYSRAACNNTQGGTPATVVARVTLTFSRNMISLPKALQAKVGYDGEGLSRSIKFPWAAVEHWRIDGKWYEFCLVQPGKMNTFINTWRVRPICVIKDGFPTRVWGGVSTWPANLWGWIILIGTYVLIFALLGSR